MTEANRRLNIESELDRSRRSRAAAERDVVAGDYDSAAARLYFSAMHAARSLLFSEGLEPKTHRGVKHLLNIHFVHPGLLPDWTLAAYALLEGERDIADYSIEAHVTEERARRLASEADRLISSIEGYLRAKGFV